MPNMPNPEKQKVSLQLTLRAIARMDHIAKAAGFSRNEVAQTLIDRGTADVVLTDEEQAEVNAKIERNRRDRKNR